MNHFDAVPDDAAPRAAAADAHEPTDEVLAGCPPLERLLEVLEHIDHLNATALDLVDRLQESGEAEALTGLPLEVWLSARGRQVRSDRQMLGTAADVLRWLPTLRLAFARGQVSWGQVRAIVLMVVKLPSHLHDAIDAELAAAIPALEDAEPDALLHVIRRVTSHAEPTSDDRDEQRSVRERFLALQPRLDGPGGTMYGEFDPLGFAVLDSWFSTGPPPAGRSRDRVGGSPDPDRREATARELGRRRADQLIERLAEDLAGPHAASDATGGPTGRARPRPTLLLRLPYASLLGGEVPGELLTTLTGGRLRLSAQASRELVATGGADLRTIVVDEVGEVLGVGRRTRVPPRWLRDAVLARDATCSAPGCRVAARLCHLDHAHRAEDGGPTDAANPSPLCATDNHARERDGWDARGDPDGARRWRHRRTGVEVRHVPDTWRPPPTHSRTGSPRDGPRRPTGPRSDPPALPANATAPRRDPARAPAPVDPSVPF